MNCSVSKVESAYQTARTACRKFQLDNVQSLDGLIMQLDLHDDDVNHEFVAKCKSILGRLNNKEKKAWERMRKYLGL